MGGKNPGLETRKAALFFVNSALRGTMSRRKGRHHYAFRIKPLDPSVFALLSCQVKS